MKRTFKYILSGVVAVSLLQSCKKDFLNLNPETELSVGNSLQSETELTLYLNNLYGRYIKGHFDGWGDARLSPSITGGSHLLAGDFMTDNMVKYT